MAYGASLKNDCNRSALGGAVASDGQIHHRDLKDTEMPWNIMGLSLCHLSLTLFDEYNGPVPLSSYAIIILPCSDRISATKPSFFSPVGPVYTSILPASEPKEQITSSTRWHYSHRSGNSGVGNRFVPFWPGKHRFWLQSQRQARLQA